MKSLSRAFGIGAVLFAALGSGAQADTWTSGKPLPTAVQAPAVAVVNSKIYVIGGATNSAVVKIVQVYNPKKNKWSTAASMPTARFTPAAAVVNGIIYVIGGNSGGGVLNTVEAYDPATNSWSTKAPMTTARDSLQVVALAGGPIYAIGGYSGTRTATVESYNPVANTWATEPSLKVGKSLPAVGYLGGILAAGGLSNSGVTADTELLQIGNPSWKTIAPMITGRQATCAGVIGSNFYTAGGDAGAGPTSVVETYNKTTKTWSGSLAPLPQPLVSMGSAVYKNRLYCFGGSNDGRIFQGSVFGNLQIYQP